MKLTVAFYADDETDARRQLDAWVSAEPNLTTQAVLSESREGRRFTFELRVGWAA